MTLVDLYFVLSGVVIGLFLGPSLALIAIGVWRWRRSKPPQFYVMHKLPMVRLLSKPVKRGGWDWP